MTGSPGGSGKQFSNLNFNIEVLLKLQDLVIARLQIELTERVRLRIRMAPHECHVNCRRFRGYGELLTPDELAEFRRLRIELTPDDFQAYTSSYIRRLLFAYLSHKPMDDCLIVFNSSTLDNAQFQRLIFTACFNRKNVGTFRRLCAYEEKKHLCIHPDHYEFK